MIYGGKRKMMSKPTGMQQADTDNPPVVSLFFVFTPGIAR